MSANLGSVQMSLRSGWWRTPTDVTRHNFPDVLLSMWPIRQVFLSVELQFNHLSYTFCRGSISHDYISFLFFQYQQHQITMAHSTTYTKYGGWLPSNPIIHKSFLTTRAKLAKDTVLSGGPTVHVPAVEEFKNAIESDVVMNDLFGQIFLQVSEDNEVSGSIAHCRR